MFRVLKSVCAVVLVLVMVSSTFAAGLQTFSTISKTDATIVGDLFSEDFGPPGLNNSGTVAFFGRLGGPIGDTFLFSDDQFTNPLPATVIAQKNDGFDLFIEEPVVNDAGTVAFNGIGFFDDDGGFELDGGMFTGDGGLLTKVLDILGGFSVPGGTVSNYTTLADINNAGTVVFQASLDSGIRGVYTGIGGPLTTIIDNQATASTSVRFGSPTINSAGTIAYRLRFFNTGHNQIFTTAGGGTLIADTDDGFSTEGFGLPTINDAGTVVFSAQFASGLEAVLTGNGGPLTTIVDSNGPLDSFPVTAINNDGDVAYLATYDVGNGSAIFNGPDPILQKVIGVGDAIFGKIVTHIDFGREGFNDNDQIAFAVRFTDGSERIVRTTPISRAFLKEVFPVAQLTTAGGGESIKMSQNVDAPPAGQIVNLTFDYRFLATEPDSFLRVLINGNDLAQFKAQATDQLNTVKIPVDLRNFFPGPPPDEVMISLLLEGPDQTLQLDNITFNDNMFINGDFEIGDFTGWQFDLGGNGSALVVGEFVLIPEPTSLVLLILSLLGLFTHGHRRRRA